MEEKSLTKIVRFNAGEVIVSKGQHDTGIYYVKDGIAENVDSGILYGNSKECHNQFFGLIGSINKERTSTIIARTDVEVLLIDFSVISENESIHTIVFQLMKESVEIIIGLENKNSDLMLENDILRKKIRELKSKK